MKLNTKNLKRISTDEKCTVLQHPDGHEIKIAHGGLTKKMRAELNSIPLQMAEGGEVNFVPPVDQEEISKAYPVEAVNPEDSYKPSLPLDQVQNLEKANLYAPTLKKDREYYERTGALNKPSPEAVDAAPSIAPDAGPAPASIAPDSVAPPVAAPAPSAGVAQSVPSLVGQEVAGLNQEAAAIGQLGKQEAEIHNESIAAQQKMAADFEVKSAEIQKEFNEAMADYKAGHINPQHYMESMSSGQKVRSAIGMILSGIGSGLAGQENMAEKFLNQQIDRDIKAQEANLGKQENLLKYNMQKFGNLRDATQMTVAMQKGLYAEKLEAAAALAKDPIAKGKALQAAAKFKLDAMETMQKLATTQVMQGQLNNPNASPLQKIMGLPKEVRDNAVKEYGDWKAIQTNLGQVDKILDANFKASSLGANITSPIQSAKARDVAYAQLFPVIKSIVGEKMTDNDAKTLIGPYLAGFTTNEKTNEQIKRKLKEQLVAQARGRTPILSEYKIVPDLQGMIGADKNEKLLNWAKANPKDPRAKQIMEKIGK